VLITTVGTIGNSAVVQPDLLPANSDRHLGIIRLHEDAEVDPYFLSAFLNSEFGRFQSLREATGNVQLNLFIEKIRTLLVPGMRCEAEVARLTRSAYAARLSASRHVSESEAAVIKALSLQKLDLRPSKTYTLQLSDMFEIDRFGAEFFMPAKFRAQEALAKGSSRPLSFYVESIKQMWNPQAAGAQLVRNFDLTHALEPFLDERVEPREAHTIASVKKVLRQGDVVISRLRSYLKQIAIVRCDNTVPITGSSEFIVLRPIRELGGEVLLAFLRSEVVQTILTWSQDGTNHPRFDERVLLSIPVPDRLVGNQARISRPIEASIADRQTMLARLQDGRRLIETEILSH
jgi:type I restriction enzyme, S subunit